MLKSIHTALLGAGLFYIGLTPNHATTSILKNGPAGVMCLVNQSLSVSALAADPGWLNPNVKGFCIRQQWSSTEPSPGVFNWALFDEAVLLARTYGKTVGLSVGAGSLTPTWVYTAGAQQFTFALSDTTEAVMPLPWDPVFQSAWSGLITAMGQRYDGNPVVSYIVMCGSGRDYENFYVSTATDTANFNALGGQTLWGPATEAIVKFYMTSFPHTHIIYAMAPPIPGAIGQTMSTTMVNWAFASYPGQFGVCCASLVATTPASTPSVSYITKYSTTTTTGFQMYGPIPKIATTLSGSLTTAIKFKAHYVEVYSYDCADPTEQLSLIAGNIGLLQVASVHP